ncbi:MAG: hypothetical protein CMF25_06845 [Kangiellaceae bacterium]|nr:hypothetical protein [Kangiellaceae bacterium]|tara:strand:+ start:7694 stop:9085 length:1392 start_codon:yes stop_codon:yes gene_type:complete
MQINSGSFLTLIFVLLTLSGCATHPSDVYQSDCEQLLTVAEAQAKQAGLWNGSHQQLPQPGLSIDRMLAFKGQSLNGEREVRLWLQYAAENYWSQLESAWSYMPAPERDNLLSLKACHQQLNDSYTANWQRLRPEIAQWQAQDSYLEWRRWLGGGWLMQWPLSIGVANWHQEARESFGQNSADKLVRYKMEVNSVDDNTHTAMPEVRIRYDALGYPHFDQESALWRYHAPQIEVAVEGEFDRLITPYRDSNGEVQVSAAPIVFTHKSYTQWQGKTLLQLNYQWWFSERPGGLLNIYAGKLDGIIWRVTLDEKGRALWYDTIHSCGCYYQLFIPQDKYLVASEFEAERPLIFSLTDWEHGRATIRISSREHQVVGVDFAEPFSLGEEYELTRLENLNYRTSLQQQPLFGKHGIVDGTERLERWLLWPTGVRSPGAMRLVGNHAIAFIGERHFDDPHLYHELLVE